MRKVDAEGYASTSRQVDPWNSLSSTILEAHSQLVTTPSGPNAFRIMWAVALHDDDDFVVACLEKRLLGAQQIVVIDPLALAIGKTVICYHHSGNDFERCPGMDAAVLGTRKGANLFVNFFSERRAAFRRTRLHRMFDGYGAVVDPEVEVANGSAVMIGSDFAGPRNGNNQAAYLRAHFGIVGNVMKQYQFAAVATMSLATCDGENAG